ncbi:MAG: hypothetical protein JKY88_05395 [Pseudomonadales bacterium]|nr:hypothetical protein [Pseudomonadales bacterium]
MSKDTNRGKSKVDWFTRWLAIAGLVTAIIAIIIPVLIQRYDDQERLSIWMRTNPGGYILVPDSIANSNVVQVPWLFTLSNVSKITLSITGFNVTQIQEGGRMKFSHMTNAFRNADDSDLILPITLSSGESKTIKLHIGFESNQKVLELLTRLHTDTGAFTHNESFKYLAKQELTMYGGTAERQDYPEGGIKISVNSEFWQQEPIYQVDFFTGRGSTFYVQGSDTMSRFSGPDY